MIRDPVDERYGISASEWIAAVPFELPIDAVGLWQIVGPLKYAYFLSGRDLIFYVRKCLLLLFSHGAIPVIGDVDGTNDWVAKEGYGGTPEEMAESIIAEWIASGRDPDFGDVWFALPDRL